MKRIPTTIVSTIFLPVVISFVTLNPLWLLVDEAGRFALVVTTVFPGFMAWTYPSYED